MSAPFDSSNVLCTPLRSSILTTSALTASPHEILSKPSALDIPLPPLFYITSTSKQQTPRVTSSLPLQTPNSAIQQSASASKPSREVQDIYTSHLVVQESSRRLLADYFFYLEGIDREMRKVRTFLDDLK